MTFSPLTRRSVSTDKRSSRGGAAITRMIVHYTAGGDTASNVRELSVGRRQVSSTYVLGRDGELVGIVPEEMRPWTSGSRSADAPSVTIETVATHATGVTEAQLDMLARLAADLCRRYKWGRLDRARVRGHREFQATDCPGPLWSKLDEIVARANRLLGTDPVAPTPRKEVDLLDQKDRNDIAAIVFHEVWQTKINASSTMLETFREIAADVERNRVQLAQTQADMVDIKANQARIIELLEKQGV